MPGLVVTFAPPVTRQYCASQPQIPAKECKQGVEQELSDSEQVTNDVPEVGHDLPRTAFGRKLVTCVVNQLRPKQRWPEILEQLCANVIAARDFYPINLTLKLVPPAVDRHG